MKNIFRGELVRLSGDDPQTVAEAFSRWNRDSEYARLLDDEPPKLYSVKSFKAWLERKFDQDDEFRYFFTIRTLEGDQLIGFIGLFGIQWNHGSAWVGIGLGERDYWGKGYGTDAMRLILRYAFRELNLYRLNLDVFAYNPRAIRSYEKAGFKIEGREPKSVLRDGQRYDMILMGILREEWEKSVMREAYAKDTNAT
jgi:RimJ/RimL family protein N-acetyltransferase